MSDERFIGYVGPADLHDATIVEVREQGNRVIVQVRPVTGPEFALEFDGVYRVSSNRPVGMMLYAISEMGPLGQGRKFVFANWDEEDDATLEVHADNFRVTR